MNDFSLAKRADYLARAAEGVVDLLVVGGGITGAGVAREAALKGLSVALVDKGDFASGTSSRSSKLIHGGVRYLAQGEVALVREAARERAVLRAIAPHLARPVRMMIPAGSVPTRMKLAAGLWTFDRLAGSGVEAAHEVLDRSATCAAEPGLKNERLAGSVLFTEYVTNDSRLTLETIKSAVSAGAWVANYAEVSDLVADQAGMRATIDARGVGNGAGTGRLQIRARTVVNAAGPWFDRVRGLCEPGSQPITQLTRGIHLVVPHHRLPVTHSVVLRSPDGRSTFVVPSGAHAYIGTTDTHYSGEVEEPGVSADDARYLLDSLAATFEDAPSAEDVIGTWSGVRPLLRQDGKKPSEISRRDELRIGPGPVVAITGGKLTTYRRMAERVVDEVFTLLGRSPVADVDSGRLALVGGNAEEQARSRSARSAGKDLAPALEDRLWQTYGVAAAQVAARMDADADKAGCPDGLDALTYAEIDHIVDQEMVHTLDDVLRRRSHLAMFDTGRAIAAAGEVAAYLGERLGWDEDRVAAEVEGFAADRKSELAVVRGEPA